MSFITPPRTGPRGSKNKENREIDLSCHVVFAKDDKVHLLTSPPLPQAAVTIPPKVVSAPKVVPGRSILKKSHRIFLTPFEEDEPQRDVTPEPADPLCNLAYLEYPVSVITRPADAGNAPSLRELIEAYSILTARLRSCVSGLTDVDASWPLFQPLRKRKDAFVAAVVRDLGKALISPSFVTEAGDTDPKLPERVLLPSPKNTPKKKKSGMTAEQVKYARDLCTTSHAVIRLLTLVFTLPAVCGVFTDNDLRLMLTAVLAIPLVDDLPTLNARKTCALAIWLLQTQRLPSAVLAPAADRIAFALARGIDGELGKDGKKGSVSDGLKAVHDLSIHAPAIFVPAFANTLLPSVLVNLLAPTLALRTLACHALGGFVLGVVSLPRNNELHASISDIVAEWFMRVPPPRLAPQSPTKASTESTKGSSAPPTPTKPADPAIIRTLRTVLQATNVAHVAHGPVWGLLVIAALMVLMGERVARDGRVGRVVNALVSLAMRHRRNAVRGLACLVWRGIMWVWCQPSRTENGSAGEEQEDSKKRKARQQWWDLVISVPELEMGVSTIAALLGCVKGCEGWLEEEGGNEEMALQKALQVLNIMAEKDGPTAGQTLDVLKELVGRGMSHRRGDDQPPPSLLPRSLFSALPGLLTVDYRVLGSAVNPLFDETPKAEDVRCLTREEVYSGWTGLIKAWRGVLGCTDVWEQRLQSQARKIDDEGDVWHDLLLVWEGLVTARVVALQDENDDEGMADFAVTAVDVIVDFVLQDEGLDMSPKSRELPSLAASSSASMAAPASISSTGLARKLKFSKALWSILQTVFPQTVILARAAEKLLASLMKNATEYVDFTTTEGRKKTSQWVEFCVNVLVVCGSDALHVFWSYPDPDNHENLWVWDWTPEQRASVWSAFCKRWMETREGDWESGAVVLGVPFVCGSAWELSKMDGEVWHELLEYSVNKALDYGHEPNAVLGCLAATVSGANQASPTAASSCVQLVEFLMSHIVGAHDKGDEIREIPESVLELVNETMAAAYPPAPREKTRYLWAARAVGEVVEKCPPAASGDTVRDVVKCIMDGVAVWVEDGNKVWSPEELEYDIVPLYQNLLVRIQELPNSVESLTTFAAFIGCPFTAAREEVREMCMDSFKDFWEVAYSELQKPAKGWPEEINVALETVFGASAVALKDEEQVLTTNDVTPPSVLESPPSPLSPSRVAFKLVPALWTPLVDLDSESPSAGWAVTRPTTPTTPTAGSRCSFATSHATTSTPPRPHKPPVGNFNFFTQRPPVSPGSPDRLTISGDRPTQTPRATPAGRTPRNVLGSSANKRRRLEDKENDPHVAVSPAQHRIRSVAERIDEMYYGSQSENKAASKRRVLDCDEERVDERPSPMKKVRRAAPKPVKANEGSESEDEDMENVEAVLHNSDDEDIFEEDSPPFATLYCGPSLKPLNIPVPPALAPPGVYVRQPNRSNKRKRVFMDAVEVPSLAEAYGFTSDRRLVSRTSSFDTAMKGKKRSTEIVKPRRTRSALKATRDYTITQTTKKNTAPTETFASDDVPSSDPIEVRPRSASGRRTVSQPVALSSSDDDPHLGQVTPHHLVSPPLKHGRGRVLAEVDFGSDDSVPSPSKDVVERKLKRIESFTLKGEKPLKPLLF